MARAVPGKKEKDHQFYSDLQMASNSLLRLSIWFADGHYRDADNLDLKAYKALEHFKRGVGHAMADIDYALAHFGRTRSRQGGGNSATAKHRRQTNIKRWPKVPGDEA